MAPLPPVDPVTSMVRNSDPSAPSVPDDPPPPPRTVAGGWPGPGFVRCRPPHVGAGEVDEGTVESARRTQVARDRDAVPGPGVGPGEGPPAEVGVRGETARHHLLDLERPLPVAELSDVEVALGGVDPGDPHPAEEDVAHRLHELLPDDHAFPVVVLFCASE